MKFVEIRIKLLSPAEAEQLPKMTDQDRLAVQRYLQEVEDQVNNACDNFLLDLAAFGVATFRPLHCQPQGEGPMTASATAAKVIEAISPLTAGAKGVAASERNSGCGSRDPIAGAVERSTTSATDREPVFVDQPSLGTRCGPRPDPDILPVPGEHDSPRPGADRLLLELTHIASRYHCLCNDPDFQRLLPSIIDWAQRSG